MILTDKIKLLIVIACVALFNGCSCPGNSSSETVLTDSPESRYQQALELVKVYPTAEWQKDVNDEISRKTGPEVATQFSSKVSQAVDAKRLLEIRTALLTDTFTADELRQLAKLLSTESGKSSFKKLRQLDERLLTLISPELTSLLSGK